MYHAYQLCYRIVKIGKINARDAGRRRTTV
jgi:hypothetical protein